MAGHVFITRGDLTKLHCDAWLMPTDVRFNVSHSWRAGLPSNWDNIVEGLWRRVIPAPQDWGNTGVRVARVGDDSQLPHDPRPYLVNVGAWPGVETDWYLEGARQFFRVVAEDLTHERLVARRSKPLVALPLIGVGHGGAGDIKGDIVLRLVEEMFRAAEPFDFDIALVLNNQPAYIAAQNARRRVRNQTGNSNDTDLDGGLISHAQRLASNAAQGRLVLSSGQGSAEPQDFPTGMNCFSNLPLTLECLMRNDLLSNDCITWTVRGSSRHDYRSTEFDLVGQ